MNKIKDILVSIINYFTNNDFKNFIKGLLLLREEATKFDPQNFDLGLLDLLMDMNDGESMFDWIVSSINKEPTEKDWEAAGYIAADIQDILNKSNIFIK